MTILNTSIAESLNLGYIQMTKIKMISLPLGDCVTMSRNPIVVILSEAKNLKYSKCYKFQILRLTPQNDITTQSPRGDF